MKKNPEPKVGQKIYIPTSLYLSHGMDDFIGGVAKIKEIHKSNFLPVDHCNYLMVEVEENPGTSYNWLSLLEEQDKLKREFGRKKAHPDPDDRPEFNMWD
jgi:hypothetical protein